MAALAIVVTSRAFACGPFFPNNILGSGDQAVLQAPVADFERELARMDLVKPMVHAMSLGVGQSYAEQATEAEMTDLSAALKRQNVSSEQAIVIMQTHLAERMKLNAYAAAYETWSWPTNALDAESFQVYLQTNPPPSIPSVSVTPGLPREFALYFKGCIAWQEQNPVQAHECWENILSLPDTERQFKSTWAAYMIGRAYEATSEFYNYNEAAKKYALVRDLAKAGFADSLGLAVASMGSEAKMDLWLKNFEPAIELYLQQYAAGDNSAIMSLRFTASSAINDTNTSTEQLVRLAKNSKTRRLITAYLISRSPYKDPRLAETDENVKLFFERTAAWVEAIESAVVKDVEYASQIALAAYQANQMDIAQRWVNRAKREPVAQWLQAKLLMRAGKTDEATKLMAKLIRKLPTALPGTNSTSKFADSLHVDINDVDPDYIAIGRQAYGELGALRLARREYTQALDALLRSGYWEDSAYVAERVLTLEELRVYVDKNWPAKSSKAGISENPYDRRTDRVEDIGPAIRYLLARRMAREGNENAVKFYPTNFTAAYQQYIQALHDGLNENMTKEFRSKNLFTAAVIMRTNGMELFGTELDPDWALYGGDFAFGSSSREGNQSESKINAASSNEVDRVNSSHALPDKRFHYRYLAANLAWDAATLMPDNYDETARVLCQAGTWLKYRDPIAADKFYKALVRRCRNTVLGQEADHKRWFPELEQ